jgi:hypothetical protein
VSAGMVPTELVAEVHAHSLLANCTRASQAAWAPESGRGQGSV